MAKKTLSGDPVVKPELVRNIEAKEANKAKRGQGKWHKRRNKTKKPGGPEMSPITRQPLEN